MSNDKWKIFFAFDLGKDRPGDLSGGFRANLM
jgi:hypothetical protein